MSLFFFIGGTRVVATFERRRKARCGRCLTQTTQGVSTFARSTKLYYFEVASDDLGRIAECEACHTRFPVKLAEGADKKERWADSFLDAHIFEIERADQSETVSAIMIGMGVAVLAAIFAGLSRLNGVAIDGGALFLILLLVLALAVTLIVRLGARMREHIGDPIFARAIRDRLALLDARWEIKPADLAKRASLRGYPRLARHFSTSRYAARAAPDIGPYRS